MENSRRTFLKIAGISALGLSAKPVLNAFAVSEHGEKKEAQVLAINQLKVYINKDDLKDDLMVIIESQKEIKNLDKINIIENHVFAALK